MAKQFDLRLHPEDRDRAYDMLIAYLRDPKGHTIRECAEKFGVNYYTIRVHVMKLIDERRLEKVPGFGKATYYRAVDFNGMPEILGTNLWDFVEGFANPDTALGFTMRTRQFIYDVSRLFYYAGLHFDGGTVTRKQLNELKQSFQADLSRAENWCEALRTILNHDELFSSPESLKKALMFDPDVPITSKDIDRVCGNHTARYETTLRNP
jgi:hypothetical protein